MTVEQFEKGSRQRLIDIIQSSGKYPDLDFRIIDYKDLQDLAWSSDGFTPLLSVNPLWKSKSKEEGEIENRFLPRPVVYISSPYTLGDVAVNVKRQLDVANELLMSGFAPLAPLYSHFQHMAHPQHYSVWLDLDKTWVAISDCVLRLPGKSSGANMEVAIAEARGIPVYYSVEDLQKAYANAITIELTEV